MNIGGVLRDNSSRSLSSGCVKPNEQGGDGGEIDMRPLISQTRSRNRQLDIRQTDRRIAPLITCQKNVGEITCPVRRFTLTPYTQYSKVAAGWYAG